MAHHPRFNREILGSITFEPTPKFKSSESQRSVNPVPPTASTNSSGAAYSFASRSAVPPASALPISGNKSEDNASSEGNTVTSKEQQRKETLDMVITCMKLALSKSISNISLPEKNRPLDPRKDFSIASNISFQPKPNNLRRRGAASFNDTGGSSGCCCTSVSPKVRRRPPLTSAGRHDTGQHSQLRQGSSTAVSSLPENRLTDVTSPYAVSMIPVAAAEPLHGDSADDDDDDVDDDAAQSEVIGRAPVAFSFTDYSPMCYRKIREFFGVDPEAYRQVVCQSTWHSVPTPGKSAAQLFFCGQNWVIKTMNTQESSFLRNILHKYFYHVRDNPHTLLPHFVGHHLIEVNGQSITFVIMQNVFATANKIHEKFDLKGSTIGRFATRAEKMKQTCTQKDLDINRPILVGPKRRQLLIDQLKKDCDFLKRSSIMDYSLLVGIHVIPKGAVAAAVASAYNPSTLGTNLQDESPQGVQSAHDVGGDDGVFTDGRAFTADQGGLLSSDDVNGRREIYYIGIIDILQEYTLWKRSETLVQGLRFDMQRISSVHPTDYASRFLSFMSSLLV